MLGVGEVQVDGLIPGEVRAAGDLPEAGDAGADGELAHHAGFVLCNLAGERGTRAHEGHVATQDVEQLGQLVDRRLAQKGSDARNTRIVGHFEHDRISSRGVGLIGLHEGGFELFGVHAHGAELKHGKSLAVEADALLSEESGAAVVQAHHRSDDDPQRSQQDNAEKSSENVAHALDGVVGGGGKIRRVLECESRGCGSCGGLRQGCHLCVFLLLHQTQMLHVG